MKNQLSWNHIEERIVKAFMYVSLIVVVGSLVGILYTVIVRGLPALSIEMLTQIPHGGYYLGEGGGILNAIVGSLYLAGGGTLLALLVSLPIAFYLNIYGKKSRWGNIVRLSLDVMWGIPSIVYGAFGFAIMLAVGMRASLLGGIFVLALLELPILARAIDEITRMIPSDLGKASYALGATKLETAFFVILRQMLPGLATAVMLAFGRGIGDAASVLFTAGYTDQIPDSLMSPVASLPLAVFFQLATPFPEVQQRAYASALVLTFIVLLTSFGSRWLSNKLGRYAVK